jgi:hypothetical protein
VVRFRAGQVRFNLHDGSQDPPAGTAIGPESSSLVSTSEIPELLGAFNGGFKVNAAAGGVEVDGHTLTPLLNGFASFVIDTNGIGRIGVWGSTVPIPGEQVASVRQNLRPLIEGGQMSAQIGNLAQWGATLHGLAATARSALGEDAAGDILYAASMSALPRDLALALSDDGAIDAMGLATSSPCSHPPQSCKQVWGHLDVSAAVSSTGPSMVWIAIASVDAQA